jgi:hypothetical protein
MTAFDPQFPPTPKRKRKVSETLVRGAVKALPRPGDRKGWRRFFAWAGGTLGAILGMRYLGLTGEQAWLIQSGVQAAAGFQSGTDDPEDDEPVIIEPSSKPGRPPTFGR